MCAVVGVGGRTIWMMMDDRRWMRGWMGINK